MPPLTKEQIHQRLRHVIPPCTSEGVDLTLRSSALAAGIGVFATLHDGPPVRDGPGREAAEASRTGGNGSVSTGSGQASRVRWPRVAASTPLSTRHPSQPFPALLRSSLYYGAASGAIVLACFGTYSAVRCTLQRARGRDFADGPSSILGGAAAGSVMALVRPGGQSPLASVVLGAGCGFVYHFVRAKMMRERLGI